MIDLPFKYDKYLIEKAFETKKNYHLNSNVILPDQKHIFVLYYSLFRILKDYARN